MNIEPTIGRVVWFYPTERDERGFRLSKFQACDAHIIFVQEDGTVNLIVFTHEGVMVTVHKVRLLQEGEEPKAGEPYATWVPYQVGQAKKQADEIDDLMKGK